MRCHVQLLICCIQNYYKTPFYTLIWQETNAQFSYHKQPTNLEPSIGDPRIVDIIKGVSEALRHDDSALNGQLEVNECQTDLSNNPLHSLHFLA